MRHESIQVQAEHPVFVTNPQKLLWPEAGVTKAMYMQYLATVAPVMLGHLRDRPLTVIRYPHGIHGHSFYQKNKPAGTPDWVTVTPVWSSDRNETIHCILVDKVATLLWLANMACLELHVGFSTIQDPRHPTSVAFDLDPSVPGFEPVREVALTLHELLSDLRLPHAVKTSGATGLQVFIPLKSGHTFSETRVFTQTVAEFLLARMPHAVTLERLKRDRGRKVYVDYLQHGEHRTLIAPYSARATVNATVSAPVTWEELAQSAVPEQFTIHTMPRRLQNTGDLMDPGQQADIREMVNFLKQKHRLR